MDIQTLEKHVQAVENAYNFGGILSVTENDVHLKQEAFVSLVQSGHKYTLVDFDGCERYQYEAFIALNNRKYFVILTDEDLDKLINQLGGRKDESIVRAV